MSKSRLVLWAVITSAVLGLILAADAVYANTRSKPLGLVWDTDGSVSANTDLLTADVAPSLQAAVVRVTVVAGTASVFNCVQTDGTDANTIGLNSSVALSAGDYYTFDIPAISGHTYNFQFETTQGSGYPLILVQEVEQ